MAWLQTQGISNSWQGLRILWRVSFMSRMIMSRGKVLRVQNRRRWTLQCRNWWVIANESVQRETSVTCWAKRALRIYNMIQQEFDTASRLWPFTADQWRQVTTTRWSRIPSSRYWISTLFLRVKMYLWVDFYVIMHSHDAVMHMIWCNSTCNYAMNNFFWSTSLVNTWFMSPTFSGLSKNARIPGKHQRKALLEEVNQWFFIRLEFR
jgi:hypothetical protein